MRVYSLNNCSNGSTGMIMTGIHDELKASGHDSRMAWARGRAAKNDSEHVFNSKLGVYVHGAMGRLTDSTGFHSAKATKELLADIDAFRPDIVQLHNIHGYCLDMDSLFNGLKRIDVPVVWTLHSCWAFTGHCSYFTYARCEQWKHHCSYDYPCPQVHEFPKSLFLDRSKRNFDRKQELFTSIRDMTIVTPSQWLADLVSESFLKGYPRSVIRNGVDTTVFNKNVNTEGIREKYGIDDGPMLLGVASPWSKRKGLEDIKVLRELLPSDYSIVLVGLSLQQIKQLPQGIVGLMRTDSPEELAGLYATSDLFINPTHEDNYPTVNIEALACGTPVITYDTGGSPECSFDRSACMVTENNTPDSLAKAIELYFSHSPLKGIGINAKDKTECSKEYIELYKRILGK